MREINYKEIVESLIDTFLNAGEISLQLRKNWCKENYKNHQNKQPKDLSMLKIQPFEGEQNSHQYIG